MQCLHAHFRLERGTHIDATQVVNIAPISVVPEWIHFARLPALESSGKCLRRHRVRHYLAATEILSS
jgi:hypothetical protein